MASARLPISNDPAIGLADAPGQGQPICTFSATHMRPTSLLAVRPNHSLHGWRVSIVTAAFLNKLAKHLAVLAGLLIVGEASGRSSTGQFGIFLLIVLAALLHSIASRSRRRLADPVMMRRGGS